MKTSPLPSSSVQDDPMYQAFNLAEQAEFIYPDGVTRTLSLFEGVLLAAMYIRRKASVAMYRNGVVGRQLVFEYHDGSLRASPLLFDMMQKLLSVVQAEAQAAVDAVRAMPAQQGEDGADNPGAPSEQGVRDPSQDVASEDEVDAAAQEEPARPGSRFRRGRR